MTRTLLDDLSLGRRALLGSSLGVAALAFLGSDDADAAPTGGRALVYRGPAAHPACSSAAATAIHSRGVFGVGYVGPGQPAPLTAAALRRATLYVQPGGGEVDDAWRHMAPHRATISSWVRNGGHYLGLCLGAYLAADDPGFALWPGHVYDYKTARGSLIRTVAPQAASVAWRGRSRRMYVQDSPTFTVRRGARRVTVLARFASGHPAAVSAPVGRGRVTLVGPHPEAPPGWYPSVQRPQRWDPQPWKDIERSALAG